MPVKRRAIAASTLNGMDMINAMKRGSSLLLACLTFLICAPAARADDASQLLAKHTAFVGWKLGDPAMSSERLTGTRRSAHGVVDQLTQVRQGLVFRETLTSANGRLTWDDGFTGRVVWHADMNGFTAMDLDAAARRVLDLDVLFSEGVAALQNPTVTGQDDIAGVQFYRLPTVD